MQLCNIKKQKQNSATFTNEGSMGWGFLWCLLHQHLVNTPRSDDSPAPRRGKAAWKSVDYQLLHDRTKPGGFSSEVTTAMGVSSCRIYALWISLILQTIPRAMSGESQTTTIWETPLSRTSDAPVSLMWTSAVTRFLLNAMQCG